MIERDSLRERDSLNQHTTGNGMAEETTAGERDSLVAERECVSESSRLIVVNADDLE